MAHSLYKTAAMVHSRRDFLRYLLASPLLSAAHGASTALGQAPDEDIISSIDQALDVFDFEARARRTLPPAHWGYLATGVDGEQTLAANRSAFNKYSLRVRRLIDVSTIDTGVTLFGQRWDSPIVLSPVSSQAAFHADGELASARAAAAEQHLQILSTLSSHAFESVLEAHGGSGLWYQLYPTDQWSVTRALLERVRAAGCPVIAVTVDLNGGSNRETVTRAKRADKRDCVPCHGTETDTDHMLQRKPMFHGIDTSAVHTTSPQNMTWKSIVRIRQAWPGKLVIKGLVTREDAELAVSAGADGIIVSNHGGRAEESGRGTIECVSDVVAGTRHRVPVIVDSGFRRGTDIFKALALGATAVGVGRPYVWGLAAFGQPGVAAVLRLLRRELVTTMRQAGTRRIAEITPSALASTPHA